LDLDGIVDYIKSGNVKNIITMAGAGISTCNIMAIHFLTYTKNYL
jgi:hypothetical protein